MKKYFLIVLALLLNSSLSFINAANGNPDDGLPIDIEIPGDNRPRSIEPECYYLDGYVYIIGGNEINAICATVTRLSDYAQWSDSSTSNTLQISVPTDAGTYHLTFTLSDGSLYYGDYILL